MTLRRLPYLAVIAAIMIAITGCPPDDPTPPPNDQERVDAAQVEQFRSQMDQRLNNVSSDIDELEGRVNVVEEDRRDDLQNTVQDLRNDYQDARQRLQQPDTTDAGAWRSHRDGVRSDVNDLEQRTDRALIEHSPDRETLQSDVQTRLDRIDQQMQQVPQAQRPDNYQERRNEVEQKLAEVEGATIEQLDDLRTDLADGVEDLRSHVQDAHADMDRHDRDTRRDGTQQQAGTQNNAGQY